MAVLKGQAAAEYLVTYGWVLLVLVVVVGVIMFSGAFSLANFQQTECQFQPNLPCGNVPSAYVSPTGILWLKFNITNGLGFDMVTPTAPAISYRKGGTEYNLSSCIIPPLFVNQSNSMAIVCNTPAAVPVTPGQMGTFFIRFNYTTDVGTTHQVAGRVVAKIDKY